MEHKSIAVNAGSHSYDIFVGSGLLDCLTDDSIHAKITNNSSCKAVIITDSNVHKIYGEFVKEKLANAGCIILNYIVVPAGESSKSFAKLEELSGQILKSGIDRSTVVFALGGGVVGDLSGFLSSILLRGIKFIQIPTSLLAQVDSSVGGKTGINTNEGKNLIGSFYQPDLVLIDIDTLSTLPVREFKAGYAEIVKYGMMHDKEFWHWLQKNGRKILEGDKTAVSYAIKKSCQIKAEIVEKDEKETTGMRALLNFGHSFGHALERICGYDDRLKHGEAVAIGMVMAASLSERLNMCPNFLSEELERHFIALNIPIKPSFSVSADEMISAMSFDKKNKNSDIHLILLEDIGKAVVKSGIDSEYLFDFLVEKIKKWE